MKRIAVIVVGSGQIHDLTINPGTTAREVLREIGLEDCNLSRQNEAHPFGLDENVYAAVQDGEKLNAGTKVDVGRIVTVNHR
jgi:hypothetical protein